jgi:hypothetical protein
MVRPVKPADDGLLGVAPGWGSNGAMLPASFWMPHREIGCADFDATLILTREHPRSVRE